MLLGELVPPPYARATACAGPCARCGSDGAHPRLDGAAIARERTLPVGSTLSRVGLWLMLPAGERALRVTVDGPALRERLVAPTAVRLLPVDSARTDAPPWRGASLSGCVVDGRRALVAALRVEPSDARAYVVELAGLTLAAGEASLTLHVAAERGGCLTQRIALRVCNVAPPRFDVTYVAFTASATTQARRVARWVDNVTAALVAAGRWRAVVTCRVELRDGRRVTGPVRVCDLGVDGAAWRAAGVALAAGESSAVTLWDACDPDGACVEVAPLAQHRGELCDFAAWASGDDAALRARWWQAARAGDDTTQAVVGCHDEPVTPRVETAWERARGVGGLAMSAAWVERFVRCPGERAWCRGREFSGDEVAQVWPGAVEFARVSS